MKQKIIYICMLFVSLAFFSCSSDEEGYSCNKEINVWVKENLSVIREMTRNDWLNLDENIKRAAYTAFTPEQKFLFWKEKMNEVLTLDWNEAEVILIELMYKTISNNPQWFAIDFLKNEEAYESFELFIYKWVENAENLGWNNSVIGSMIASGNKMLNTKGELLISDTSSIIRLKNNAEEPCDCLLNNSFMFNKCPAPFCSSKLLCDEDNAERCGALWTVKCDGLCVL